MFGEADNFALAQKKLTGVTHWYVEPLVSYPLVNGTTKRQNETGRNCEQQLLVRLSRRAR